MKVGIKVRARLAIIIFLVVGVLSTAGIFLQPNMASADIIQGTKSTTSMPEFIPDILLPGLFEREVIDSNLFGKYLRAVFVYMVWSVGVLSTVMLVFGGIKWVAAAGNPGQINDAKDVITNSIIGLIIGLTSVVLLNVINPELQFLPNLNTGRPVGKMISFIPRQYPDFFLCKGSSEIPCGESRNVSGTYVDHNNKSENIPEGTQCWGTYCAALGEICHYDFDTQKYVYLPGKCVKSIKVESTDNYGKSTGIVTDISVAPKPSGGKGEECGMITMKNGLGSERIEPSCYGTGLHLCYTLGSPARLRRGDPEFIDTYDEHYLRLDIRGCPARDMVLRTDHPLVRYK